jgi:peptidase E
MPRLFLSSEQDLVLAHLSMLAKIDPVTQKVGFIVNATDPYRKPGMQLPWIEKEFQQWCDMGYKAEMLDLLQVKASDLGQYDILHFAGGNPLYLCLLLRDQGLVSIIQDLILNKNIIFSGSSAGSMIAGLDVRVEFFADLETYPENKELIPKFNGNFHALKLIPFNLIPHYNDSEYSQQYSLAISDKNRSLDPLIFLSDGQAIWMEGDVLKIVTV